MEYSGTLIASGQSDQVVASYQGANIVIAANADDQANGIRDPEHPEVKRSFAEFNQPLIANGQLSLRTFSAKVIVYGRLGTTGAIAARRR